MASFLDAGPGREWGVRAGGGPRSKELLLLRLAPPHNTRDVRSDGGALSLSPSLCVVAQSVV